MKLFLGYVSILTVFPTQWVSLRVEILHRVLCLSALSVLKTLLFKFVVFKELVNTNIVNRFLVPAVFHDLLEALCYSWVDLEHLLHHVQVHLALVPVRCLR